MVIVVKADLRVADSHHRRKAGHEVDILQSEGTALGGFARVEVQRVLLLTATLKKKIQKAMLGDADPHISPRYAFLTGRRKQYNLSIPENSSPCPSLNGSTR